MRLVATHVCVLALLCVPAVFGQRGEGDAGLGRLIAIGRLWATIVLPPRCQRVQPGRLGCGAPRSHPSGAGSTFTRGDTRPPIRGMIGRLDDPLTRIGEDVPAPPPADYGFASVEPRGRVLLVTSGRVAGDPLDTAGAVRKHLGEVDSVIFDLRPGSVHPWLWDGRWFSTEPLPHPAHRFRLHAGNAPIRGAEGVPFFSGIVTRSAPMSQRRTGAAKKRVIFLVRDGDELPLLAAALQDVGQGWNSVRAAHR